LQFANNIQAIQNSIESGIPENGLSSRTVLPDAEEFDLRNGEEEEMGYEDLPIGDLLSPVPRVRLRQTPPVSILISAGSSYKDHNFVQEGRKKRRRRKTQFAQ
jgi:hypothetical protein